MKILALNSGSSSIKYRLFDSDANFRLLEQGSAERIGQENSSISCIKENQTVLKEEVRLPDHRTAMSALFLNEHSLLIEVAAVGHRIVHGGERYINPLPINKEVIQEIAELAKFAPLHCKPNVIGIEVLQELLPNVPHAAIFDTSAHAAMPFKAFLYGIPLEYYEKYKIRKYGFHGINHSYAALKAASLLKKPLEKLKVITCHLGNGCSINAFEKGKSIDNSMGLTPLEGLVMGTRCGDLDPSVALHFIEKFKLSTDQVNDLLNKKSGLLGLCGKSDMRDIISMAKDGGKTAQMAIEIFVYRIQKYIGAYIAALNGLDILVFTGGIGENSPYIRALILKNFSYLGARLDVRKNEKNDQLFSADDSLLYLMNIPANEELVIAQQTHQLFFTSKSVNVDKV